MRLSHGFGPLFDQHSKVLVLGSFPSVKSREKQFYYGHPQNRFWPLIARILSVPVPETIEEKRLLALSHGIALWDVIDSCEITGSADSSIKNPEVTDLQLILEAAPIRQIFVTAIGPHLLRSEELLLDQVTKLIPLPCLCHQRDHIHGVVHLRRDLIHCVRHSVDDIHGLKESVIRNRRRNVSVDQIADELRFCQAGCLCLCPQVICLPLVDPDVLFDDPVHLAHLPSLTPMLLLSASSLVTPCFGQFLPGVWGLATRSA